MWVSEVVLQGVFGISRAARIKLESPACEVTLPKGIPAEGLQMVAMSLLFPDYFDQSAFALWTGDTEKVRVGVVLEHEGETYKILRAATPASTRLQRISESGAETLSVGGDETSTYLEQNLDRPAYPEFALYHAWLFSLPDAPAPKMSSDEEKARLADLYVRALIREHHEDRARAIDGELNALKVQYEAQAKPLILYEEGLRRLNELEAFEELSEDEMQLLDSMDESETDSALAELELRLDEVNTDSGELGPWFKEPLIIGTVVAAVFVFLVSAITGLRGLALINLGILGVTASALLRYFSRLEGAAISGRQVDRIQDKMAAIGKELSAREGKAADLLSKLGVSSRADYDEKFSEIKRLRRDLSDMPEDMRHSLERRVDSMRGRMQAMQKYRSALERELNKEGGENPSYSLEADLDEAGLGTSPLKRYATRASHRLPLSHKEVFEALAGAARRWRLIDGESLAAPTRDLWESLAVQAMGDRWTGINMSKTGDLDVPEAVADKESTLFARYESSAKILACTLAAAIQVGAGKEHGYVFVADPGAGLPADAGAKVRKVILSLEGKCQVAVLTTA